MQNIKKIDEFEGYYVSTQGEIFTAWDGKPTPGKKLKLMKASKKKDGYLMISFHGGGRKKNCSRLVHRLVLETFVGPRPSGFECRHLNGNPIDNRLENLAWGTPEENLNDKIKHGTYITRSKLNFKKAKLIRILYFNFNWSLSKLARFFNVDKSTISYIKNNKIWLV